MPNRILKESICTSENIDCLSAFHETVFYRMIVNCDDFGRMDARPKILASRLFPLKDIRASQMEDALRALTSAELVTLYEVDGKPFLQMNTWDRHQTIRAKKSRFPAPDESTCTHLQADEIICKQMQADASTCSRNPIQSESNPNTNTNGKESRAAARFTPPKIEEVRAYCEERKSPVDPEQFWNYFNEGGWVDAKGQPVRNWKQKLLTWEKFDQKRPERPIKPNQVTASLDYSAWDMDGMLSELDKI